MFRRKQIALIFVGLLLNLSLSSAVLAKSKAEKRAANVKAAICKLGVGTDARVFVEQVTGSKVVGYVLEIRSESFLVFNDATGLTTEVPYSSARQVKGNNLSTRAKIAIGVGILLGVILAVALFSDDII